MTPKNTICLWFDDALEAARFYAATFPNSEVTAVHKAPGILSRVLQTGDAVIDVSMPSLAYIHGWRCSRCGLILLSPQS